ncbi:MAG: hypothetical protein PWR13_1041 [Archaeoglobi archaeon]|nr:hypothetical protein [Archaeoglobi archaeon]MDK2782013.1 hypothetical protein [Archaeoglobi archaeon]
MRSMTEEAIFIDSSIFLAFFIEGINFFEKLEGYKLLISMFFGFLSVAVIERFFLQSRIRL